MELKETKRLPAAVEINKLSSSGGNNSDKREVYNILFPQKESVTDQKSDSKYSDEAWEKSEFESITTLDWLKTWRPIEYS